MVDVLIERCAGIDIGKDEVVACVRTPAPSGRGRRKQTRTFSSFTGSLEAMGWGLADRAAELQQGTKVDVAFRLERDEYRGETYLVARIADVRVIEG